MDKVIAFFGFLVFVLFGCSTYKGISLLEQRREDRDNDFAFDGMKIGLLADSQLQSLDHNSYVALMSGQFEDSITKVAMRPQALNCFSGAMLEYFLNKLSEDAKVKIIFYLGDGANNGSKDEIDNIIGLLTAFRTKRNLPVYYILGNHDYLGAGNTPKKELRIKLSGENNIYNKCDVIQKIHDFNIGNNSIEQNAFIYKDNFISIADIRDKCEKKGEMSDDLRDRYCFLAGKVEHPGKIQFLLADTSDYYGKFGLPFFVKWFGLTGWISDDQIRVLREFSKESRPELRILLTHYPKYDLSVNNYFQNENLFERMTPIFFPVPDCGNYWFSAHTHKYFDARKFDLKCGNYIEHLSIGSTTDHGVNSEDQITGPHAMKVSIMKQKQTRDVSRLSLEPVFIEIENETYLKIVDYVKNIQAGPEYKAAGINGRPKIRFEQVGGRTTGDGLFGMDKSYKKWGNKNIESYSKIVIENLNNLVPLIEQELKIDQETIKTSIGLYASLNESTRENVRLSDKYSVTDLWRKNDDGVWTIDDESFHKNISVPDWLNWSFLDEGRGLTTTKIYEFSSKGKEFKIQLWKGYYPPMPPNFPYSRGAEVGIYIKENGQWMPAEDYKSDIEYTLSDKNTDKTYFSLKNRTWWLNGWKGLYGWKEQIGSLEKYRGENLKLTVKIKLCDEKLHEDFITAFGITENRIDYDGAENIEYGKRVR